MATEDKNPRMDGSPAPERVGKVKPPGLAETDPFKKSQRLPAVKRLDASKVSSLPSPAHDCEFGNFYHL